jgi:hypothetical protein
MQSAGDAHLPRQQAPVQRRTGTDATPIQIAHYTRQWRAEGNVQRRGLRQRRQRRIREALQVGVEIRTEHKHGDERREYESAKDFSASAQTVLQGKCGDAGILPELDAAF